MEAANVRMDLELSSSENVEEPDKSQRSKKKRKKKTKQKGAQDNSATDNFDEGSGTSLDDTKRQRIVVEEDQATCEPRMSDDESSKKVNEEIEEEKHDDGRKRLYFPNVVELDYHGKLQWALRLAKTHRELEVLFKEGRNRPYITVKDNSAVEYLSTNGFENIILEIPKESDGEKFSKVIVFDYPVYMDPDDLLIDDRMVWVKRRVVKFKGEDNPKPQVIALMKGEVPGRMFVPCIGYRKVALYKENPKLCFKCSKWGHMAFKCQNSFRCRFCSKSHDSKECAEKIKNNIKITPKCCNCGEEHNARSWVCKKRPSVGKLQTTEVPAGERLINNQTTAPVVNAWEQRREMQRQREATDGEISNGNNIPDVINSLCQAVERLQNVVMNLQTQIADMSTCKACDTRECDAVSKSGVKKVIVCAEGNSHGNDIDNEYRPVNSLSDQCQSNNDGVSSAQESKKEWNNLVKSITQLLDSVIEYMTNPKDNVKSNILRSAMEFRDKIHKDG